MDYDDHKHHQLNKKFRKIFENHSWQEYIKAFENEYYSSEQSNSRNSDGWSFKLHAGIPDKLKHLRGTYIDSRLINYIAIWCSPTYAISVGKIMDSINDQVHQQLQQKQLPDTPTNARPIFEQTINAQRFVSDNENSQCWGIRETDKFDYLESWDKDYIIKQFDRFKHSLKTINMTLDELKRDYPQLLD